MAFVVEKLAATTQPNNTMVNNIQTLRSRYPGKSLSSLFQLNGSINPLFFAIDSPP